MLFGFLHVSLQFIGRLLLFGSELALLRKNRGSGGGRWGRSDRFWLGKSRIMRGHLRDRGQTSLLGCDFDIQRRFCR